MNLTAIPPKVRAALYWVGYVVGIVGQGVTIVWGAVAASSPDISMPTWLVIASAILGLLQTQLNLLAGSNVTPKPVAAAHRNQAGRIQPFLALSLALAMAIAGALLTFASPAQAAGWSGFKCDDQSKSNAAKVCVDIHSVPSGTGLRVDQVEMCAYKVPQLYYNGFRGTKGNEIEFSGSGGVFLGYVLLPNTDTSVGGTCVYTNISFQLGKGACSRTYGTLNLSANDDYFSIQQKVLGGAC